VSLPQEVGGKDLGPDLRTIVELDGEGQVGASPVDDPLHQQLRLAAVATELIHRLFL